jgi:hypothetical protein
MNLVINRLPAYAMAAALLALSASMAQAADGDAVPKKHRHPAHQTPEQAARKGIQGQGTAPENQARPPHGKTSLSASKAAGIEARKSGETVEGESQGPIKDAKLPRGRSSLAATRPAGREAERTKSTVLGEGSNK